VTPKRLAALIERRKKDIAGALVRLELPGPGTLYRLGRCMPDAEEEMVDCIIKALREGF
jgi:hypothetical protein